MFFKVFISAFVGSITGIAYGFLFFKQLFTYYENQKLQIADQLAQQNKKDIFSFFSLYCIRYFMLTGVISLLIAHYFFNIFVFLFFFGFSFFIFLIRLSGRKI